MKRIVAFVKPIMLDDVIFALHEIEDFPGARVSEAQDIGQGAPGQPSGEDRSPFHEFPKTARMEIVCPADKAERIVETIRRKAHTGLADDGDIYVSAVEASISIRAGGVEV